MILVMPEHLSVERRQTMRVGAEHARDSDGQHGMRVTLAEKLRTEGKGVILDQIR